jgi:hypothetical protein
MTRSRIAAKSASGSPAERSHGLAAAAALALLAAATGCGLGPGDADEGEAATLRITRDHGARLLAEAAVSDPTESDTVIRALDRAAEITTRFGGGFVQSIDGIEGESAGGRTSDWFFFVNGVESATGAADVAVRAGDRIWWDYRDWTDAMRAPAVVGSWPEPFAQQSAGAARAPVAVECAAERASCDEVAERLATEGVDASTEDFPAQAKEAADETLRVLVGPWAELRSDPAAAQVEDGPATSGVFASFARTGGGWELEALDRRARAAESVTAGAGLVAAVRKADEPPTWLVTGTDADGVEAAIALLAVEQLQDRYAVAVGGSQPVALPVGSGS